MGADKRSFDAEYRSGLVQYERAQMIFRPGDLVIHHIQSHPWLLLVVNTAYEENQRIGKYLEVHCMFFDHDGANFGMSKKVFTIVQKKFFGQGKPSKIVDLPIYPFSLFSEPHELKDRLRLRGDYFQSFTGISVRQYNGPATWFKQPPVDYYHPDEASFSQVWLPYMKPDGL